MSVRLLCACLTAAGLLAAGPTPARAEPPSSPKMVARTYAVADLIVPVSSVEPCVLKVSPAPAEAGPVAPACPEKPAAVKPPTMEDKLIKVITDTIAPGSWSTTGGAGTIDYYPLGMALVILQAPAVHEQVADLLESLRRLQDEEVAVEVRFVTVSDACYRELAREFDLAPKGEAKAAPSADGLQRIGIDFNAAPVAPPVEPDTATPARVSFLNDKQVYRLLEAAQGDEKSNVMQAPKVTLFNGQNSGLDITEKQFYVTGVSTMSVNGQVTFVPKQEAFETGLRLSLQPTVSADRKYVRLNLKVKQTELMTDPVPLFPVTTQIKPVGGDGGELPPLPFTQFIQQPKFNTLAADKALTIPDGGTAVLSGWARVREGEQQCGPPVLRDIPLLNELFKVENVRETEHVLLLVTPRIIAQTEATEAAAGTPHKELPFGPTCPGGMTLPSPEYLQHPPQYFPPTPSFPLKKELAPQEPAEWYPVPTAKAGKKVDDAEESEVVGPKEKAAKRSAKVTKARAAKVAKLLEQYHEACAAGRLEDAKKAARQALTLDPACFDKERATKDALKSLGQGRINSWQLGGPSEKPVPPMPERVQGGIQY
jgi:hypothetical protein